MSKIRQDERPVHSLKESINHAIGNFYFSPVDAGFRGHPSVAGGPVIGQPLWLVPIVLVLMPEAYISPLRSTDPSQSLHTCQALQVQICSEQQGRSSKYVLLYVKPSSIVVDAAKNKRAIPNPAIRHTQTHPNWYTPIHPSSSPQPPKCPNAPDPPRQPSNPHRNPPLPLPAHGPKSTSQTQPTSPSR